jgi:hypothetical protein
VALISFTGMVTSPKLIAPLHSGRGITDLHDNPEPHQPRSPREGGHGSLGAFFVVHMTMCDPFQVKAIGTLRGVPSLAA